MLDFAFEQTKKLATKRLTGKSSSSSNDHKNSKKEEPKGNEQDVVILTDSNFDELVLKSDDLWMITFYGSINYGIYFWFLAPWCGHCK